MHDIGLANDPHKLSSNSSLILGKVALDCPLSGIDEPIVNLCYLDAALP